ncbi:MAG TPA: CBS domain-containing protein [Thermomicrobiales bacterium]|nr:CBS domain-containing protein [Thermomicrobiales bacterium]
MSDHDASNTGDSVDPLVTQIMRTGVPTVSPDASIGETARVLVEHEVPGVAVVENGKLIGIITEADLIAREADVDVPTPVPFLDAIFMADAGPDFDDEMRKVLAVNARQLMTSPVISIKSSATLTEVATLMVDRRINPIPVLDEDMQVIGIVSRSDLVRIISALENQG